MLLPEPVTPANSTMPWWNLHRSSMIGGRYNPSKSGTKLFTRPGHHSHVAQLLQHIDAETPQLAVDVDGVGKVGPAGLVENAAVALVQERQAQADHLLVIDRTAIHGRSVPLTRTIGGRSTFRCKSLPLSLTSARNSLSISYSSRRPRNFVRR